MIGNISVVVQGWCVGRLLGAVCVHSSEQPVATAIFSADIGWVGRTDIMEVCFVVHAHSELNNVSSWCVGKMRNMAAPGGGWPR